MLGHTSSVRGRTVSFFGRRRRSALLAAASIVATGLTANTHAARIWDGGGANDNFNTALNWDDDLAPTNYALGLTFAGTTRLTPLQNLTNPSIGGFTFAAGAGSFTIGGNPMTLAANITNNSTNNQTIDVNMSWTGARDLVAASGDLTINGTISGSGGIVRTNNSPTGTLYLNGDNTYSNSLQVSTTGKVSLGHNNAAGTGYILLSGGTLLGHNGAREIANNVTLSANSFIAGSSELTFNGSLSNNASPAGDRTLTVNNSALTTFTSVNISGTSTSRKIVFAGSGAIDITGVIADGGGSTASGITYGGTNTLRLMNAANTYRGATAVNVGGTIAVTSLGAAGLASSIGASTNTTANLFLDGGTIKYIGTGATATDRTFKVGLAGGGIDASGGGAITWTPAIALEWVGSTTARTFTFTGSSTHDNTFAGNLTNAGAATNGPTTVAKTGAGTWILGGANTYTGATNISDGTLLITGSTASGSTVNLQKGTLGGTGDASTTGKIGGAVNVGNGVLTSGNRDATLAPGSGIGTLLTGNLTFAADGIFDVQLDGTTASTSDRVSVTGTVALGDEAAGLTVSYSAGGLVEGQKYFILLNDSSDAITGAFDNLIDASGTISTDDPIVLSNGSLGLLISYTGNSTNGDLIGGNDVVLYTAAVPEPGMLGLIGVGALGLLARRRRKQGGLARSSVTAHR